MIAIMALLEVKIKTQNMREGFLRRKKKGMGNILRMIRKFLRVILLTICPMARGFCMGKTGRFCLRGYLGKA
jgi:hypothetical protein